MYRDKTKRKVELKAALLKQLKSLLVPVIILLIILAGVLAITLYQEEEEVEEIIKVNSYEGEGEVVLENSDLKFVMDSATTQFTVIKKSTGEVWYSNPQDAVKDEIALTSDKENLQSTLLLTYSTINGVDTLYNNYKYSIASKIYNIEATDDYIKVFYSIGDVDKEYVIPLVADEARMNELLANMSKSNASTVGDYYKKYDINNLGKKDDKAALLEKYPILADEVIYVLRDGTKDNLKKKFEEYFADAGYTYEEFSADKELYASETVSEKPVFNVNVIYRLEGDDLVVDVPMSEIEYKKDYPVLNLSVLPFFGAGGTTDNGYLFVPEGGGSIINFNNQKIAQNSYYAKVYGWDMAQGRTSVVHETRSYFGVYGIAKEDSSFICMLEEGAPYASISADISGRINSYNYVNATYSIMNREQCDVADKYNGEMFMYEESIPEENLLLRYRFVDSNNYVDMAKAYQDYLLNKYDNALTKNEDADVPVAVEIVGAVDKVKQVFGIPVSKPLAVTTYKEAKDMVENLTEDGISNLSIKLSGWMNGGIRQEILTDVDLISELGNKKDFKSLITYTNNNNIKLYLDGITNYAYNSNLLDGFVQSRDVAKFISKEKVELKKFDPIYYGEQDWKDDYYLLKPSVTVNMIQNLLDAAIEYDATGVSFRDIGYDLSADYNSKNRVTRQTSMNMQIEELEKVKEAGLGIMTNMGNEYTLGHTEFITNMDLNGSLYTIIDKKIPFYQLAIHGYVNYAGNPLNNIGEYNDEILKSAEYGAGLYFVFMNANSTELQSSYYTNYYGADFDSWHKKMLEIYTRYNDELKSTYNQKMTNHEYIETGVVVTTYEDGTKVYVNYNYNDCTVNGIKLPARDYVVVQ